MKISELIEDLSYYRSCYGEIDVVIPADSDGYDPVLFLSKIEFNNKILLEIS